MLTVGQNRRRQRKKRQNSKSQLTTRLQSTSRPDARRFLKRQPNQSTAVLPLNTLKHTVREYLGLPPRDDCWWRPGPD